MTRKNRRIALYGAGLVLAGGLLFAGFGITIPPDAETRLAGASMLAGLGDHDAALAICATVLEEHPDSLSARIYRANFLAQAKRFDESIEAYDDALDRAREAEVRRSLRADRASVLLSAGRVDAFVAERDVLARDGVDFHVHMLDGLKAQRDEQWDTAAAEFQKAFAEDPENLTTRTLLYYALFESGKAHLAERDFEKSCEALDAALDLYPRVAETVFLSAEVRLAMDDAPGALEVLRRSQLTVPGVAPLAFRAATVLLEKDNLEDAVDALQFAHGADSAATRALFGKDSLWDPYRNKTVVKAVFAASVESSGADLTDQ